MIASVSIRTTAAPVRATALATKLSAVISGGILARSVAAVGRF
ncbi:hypothetical protein MiAbB_00745 [Microcystis aeruginosa NIES-4285]|uniref:Uncharacterized protein n=1 Tax=Microcystis aeruginosa NIES-4285 TaxID=2497681 RepID=A0A402D9D5_MICAE|nr:hypothetical protein MiAbB_00745 [Microcystis aeruginosa NIES-4285]